MPGLTALPTRSAPRGTARLRPLFAAALGAVLLQTCDARALDDAAGIALFEKKIRPVLIENCYKCHSAESKKLKGKLRLDSREGWLKGGESGAAITPGKPGESLALSALRYD